jgi:oligopeptidase B
MPHRSSRLARALWIALALALVPLGYGRWDTGALAAPDAPAPPKAKIVPHRLEAHGQVRTDDYYWLKERQNPEVLAYLAAENAYSEAAMAHTKELQEALYQEIIGRIKEDDETVPHQQDDYWYHERYVEGGEYPIHCRHRGGPAGPEQVILDVNALAAGHEFFSARGLQVSPGQDILAYGTDAVGRRFYTQRFRDLATGRDFPDSIPDVTGNCAWANDNRTLFYAKQHPETLRWYRIYAHVLGTDPRTDRLVYEEQDPEFSCSVAKTKSKRFLLIGCEQSLSTEYRFLAADDPGGTFTVFLPREPDHEYSIEHAGDHFIVRTNWQARNFRVMRAPLAAAPKERWSEIVPHRDGVLVEEIEVFRDHLVVSERERGLRQLHVIPWRGKGEHRLDFGEPAYVAAPIDNQEFDSRVVRYVYTSLTTPKSVFDYDMVTREKKLLKEDEVLGGFDKRNYRTERLHARAAGGTLVPISLVHRQGMIRDGGNPLLLYGYGSYGASSEPAFQSPRLSLLDRGFIIAIAHVRGGQELGRDWYDDGKLLRKKNTFTDFIDCARYLVAEKYTRADRLFAQGASAGGLLMGAVANLAPDLFAGIVAQVPFVDVVTTMLDPDIPLTTSEYDEWGDPNDAAAYAYMLSYSPYDNIVAKAYPSMLVTAGLHDSQVQYWEPAKYVAKLRVLKTDGNRLLLRTNMEAGHGGASGRFKRHRETAVAYAFLLDLCGKAGERAEAEQPAAAR